MPSAPSPNSRRFDIPVARRDGMGPSGNRQGRSVYLYPGEVIASMEPLAISTILGSCVAVCLWDAATGAGGANHFLLPYLVIGDGSSTRFGGVAMRVLQEKLLALGCNKRNLRAKVFGGASQFADPGNRVPIGQQNASLAFRILDEERIPVVAQETGGTRGRKVVFHTGTGDVWVRQL
jgi:chemotaxis protein CheD